MGILRWRKANERLLCPSGKSFLRTVFICSLWLLGLNPWSSLPVLLPAIFAATFAALDLDTNGMRWLCMAMAVIGALLFLFLSFLCQPFLVPADSDLGIGARLLSADFRSLFYLALGSGGSLFLLTMLPWVYVRISIALGMLALITWLPLKSPDATSGRWILMVLIAVALADEGALVLRTRVLRYFPFERCGWIAVIPGLVALIAWQSRILLKSII